MSNDAHDVVAYLLDRVRVLEAQVADLTAELRRNAARQQEYRRRNKDVTKEQRCSNESVTKTQRSSNDVVTPLQPLPPQTPSTQDQDQENINTYASPLSEYIAATWPKQKPLTEEQERAWREAHPGVNLLAAAKAARAWQLADPQKRTRPRVFAFLGNWFSTAQQNLRSQPRSVLSGPIPGEAEERAKAAQAAKRAAIETKERIQRLEEVKPQPMPESLRATIAKIGGD